MRKTLMAFRLTMSIALVTVVGCAGNSGNLAALGALPFDPCPERYVYVCVENSSLTQSCSCASARQMTLLFNR